MPRVTAGGTVAGGRSDDNDERRCPTGVDRRELAWPGVRARGRWKEQMRRQAVGRRSFDEDHTTGVPRDLNSPRSECDDDRSKSKRPENDDARRAQEARQRKRIVRDALLANEQLADGATLGRRGFVESCHASDPGHLPDRARAHRKSL